MNRSTRRMIGTVGMVAGALLLTGVVYGCPPTYTMTVVPEWWDAGDFEGIVDVRAFAINASGTMVGANPLSGFKWDEKQGVVVLTGELGNGGGAGACLAINDAGWVGGRFDENGAGLDPRDQLPAVWTPEGTPDVLYQGGIFTDTGGRVAGMNNAVVLVGRKYLGSAMVEAACVWASPSSQPAVYSGCLPFPGALGIEDVADVNDNGRVVGRTFPCPAENVLLASYRDPPAVQATTIELLPGDTVSAATAVNNAGTIVGYSSTTEGFASGRGFLRTITGEVVALGTIPGGPADAFPYAISERGEVVGGTALAPTGLAWRWTGADGVVDLNTLLNPPSKTWTVVEARGVNSAGQIAVTLRRNADGALRAARLDPIGCAADVNCDESVNSQDFFDFLVAFFAGAPTADFNNDTAVNSQDFFDFLEAFFSGC